jgi:hypothetical protein
MSHVGGGQDKPNARRRQGGERIHTQNASMRHRTPHDDQVESSGWSQVIGERGLATNERWILGALHGRANQRGDEGLHHGTLDAPFDGLPEQVEDSLSEVVRLERFRDESVGSAFVGSAPGFLFCVGRKNHHWELAGRRVRPDLVEYLPAIHAGEADVKDYEIGSLRVNGLQAAGTVLTGEDLEVAGPQANLDQPADDGGIFYDKDSMTHLFCLSGKPVLMLSARPRTELRAPYPPTREVPGHRQMLDEVFELAKGANFIDSITKRLVSPHHRVARVPIGTGLGVEPVDRPGFPGYFFQ